jgi:hypothetical protein
MIGIFSKKQTQLECSQFETEFVRWYKLSLNKPNIMFGNSIKGSPGQTFSVIRVVHFKTSHFPVLVLVLVGASSLKNILIIAGQDWIWLHSDDSDFVQIVNAQN